MTNGEMIKEIFPSMPINVSEDTVYCGKSKTYIGEFSKNWWNAEHEESEKIDQTVMARLLTTEELLELRTIVTKELLTRPDPIPEEEREIKMLKKIRKYCDRFKNCDGCELKTTNAQDVEMCIFNAPPCSWLDPEIEKVNEVLKENKDG